MHWFKHDTDASRDAKLIKVRMKYGLEGYGLYWYMLELIASDISESNLTFELEHDVEVVAHQTGIHYQRVQEMMSHMIDLGLFESSAGTITCLKLLKRLDQSMTSSPKLRKFVAAAKEHHDPIMTRSGLNHDPIMTSSGKVMQEVEEKKKRREEKIKDLSPSPKVTLKPFASFESFWSCYPRKTSKAAAEKAWNKLKPSEEILFLITSNINARLAVGDWELTRKDFIPHPGTYLNGKRWEDEIIAKENGNAAHQSTGNAKLSDAERVRAKIEQRRAERATASLLPRQH